MGSGSGIECPPVASVAWGRVVLKDAGRRYAVAFRPSLTATRPHAPRKVVGTEGWSIRSNIGMGERRASISLLVPRTLHAIRGHSDHAHRCCLPIRATWPRHTMPDCDMMQRAFNYRAQKDAVSPSITESRITITTSKLAQRVSQTRPCGCLAQLPLSRRPDTSE